MTTASNVPPAVNLQATSVANEQETNSNGIKQGNSENPPSAAVTAVSAEKNGKETSIEKKPKEPSATVLSKGAQLQAHLQALTTLKAHVSNLRKLPMHLLTLQPKSAILPLELGLDLDDDMLGGAGVGSSAPGADDLATLLGGSTSRKGSQAQNVFRVLKKTQQTLLSQSTQSALTVARDSEKQDKTDLTNYTRRERKKRRTANADSPAPFPTFQLHTTTVFPRLQGTSMRVENVKDLYDFIRERRRSAKRLTPGGRGSNTVLSIWAHSKPTAHEPVRVLSPLTVRVAIHDVATVFLKMSRKSEAGHDRLAVESLVALGLREKKSPHSHSDYTVYQKLTQQVTRMMEQEPNASFPQVIDLLTSYEDLFITQCSVCKRMLSQEGHIPPVARVWIENLTAGDVEFDRGRWDARHVSCLHT